MKSLKFSSKFLGKSLSVVALSLVALPAWAAPVGMAAQVKGNVQLESGGKKAPLKLLGRVESGDVVWCGKGAQAIIVLFDGGARYQIGSNTKVTVLSSQVVGIKPMPAMSGPSAAVVQKLGGARVGAVMARPGRSFERLKPDFPGWMPINKPRFEWEPLTGALHYTFTLFDQYDNVVWSARTDKLFTDFPADAPALRDQQTYLWRLSGFGDTGKPVQDSRFGFVTFLSEQDVAWAKSADEVGRELKEQQPHVRDKTLLVILAEAYRSRGILGRTLEIWEDEALRGEEGIAAEKSDVIQLLSPIARALVQGDGKP